MEFTKATIKRLHYGTVPTWKRGIINKYIYIMSIENEEYRIKKKDIPHYVAKGAKYEPLTQTKQV